MIKLDSKYEEPTFICLECGEEYKLYYLSSLSNGEEICQFCDTKGDYDYDYGYEEQDDY